MTFDETNAALDRLLGAERARKDADLERLRASVAGLGVPVGMPDAEPEPMEASPTGGQPARGGAPQPVPSVTLPQRTTHGGDFGPAVRAKLIREALDRG